MKSKQNTARHGKLAERKSEREGRSGGTMFSSPDAGGNLLGQKCDTRNWGIETSNANSFVFSRVLKMVRIIIANVLASTDHFLCSGPILRTQRVLSPGISFSGQHDKYY